MAVSMCFPFPSCHACYISYIIQRYKCISQCLKGAFYIRICVCPRVVQGHYYSILAKCDVQAYVTTCSKEPSFNRQAHVQCAVILLKGILSLLLVGSQHVCVACADGGANRLYDALTPQERNESVRGSRGSSAPEETWLYCVGPAGNASLGHVHVIQLCYPNSDGALSTCSVVSWLMPTTARPNVIL